MCLKGMLIVYIADFVQLGTAHVWNQQGPLKPYSIQMQKYEAKQHDSCAWKNLSWDPRNASGNTVGPSLWHMRQHIMAMICLSDFLTISMWYYCSRQNEWHKHVLFMLPGQAMLSSLHGLGHKESAWNWLPSLKDAKIKKSNQSNQFEWSLSSLASSLRSDSESNARPFFVRFAAVLEGSLIGFRFWAKPSSSAVL